MLPRYLFFDHSSLNTLLQGLYTIMFLKFLLHLFPYFYAILHPTITLPITQACTSLSLPLLLSLLLLCCHNPKLPDGSERLKERKDFRPGLSRDRCHFQLLCSWVSCILQGQENRNYFGVWGIHGAKIKEPLSYLFYRKNTHTHWPACQPGVNFFVQVTKKWPVFTEKTISMLCRLPHQLLPVFPALHEDEGTKWAEKSFLKLLQFYLFNTNGSTHCPWCEGKKIKKYP